MVRVGCLVLAGLCLACSPSEPPPVSSADRTDSSAVREVDVAGLKAGLDAGTITLLVDVRTPEEFASGHVPGAKNIPIDDLPGRVAEVGGPGTEVYLICRSGNRSAKAGALLAREGLKPVNVVGGTVAWQGAGLPVE